ncbi:transcriptional regulator BetI [Mesorhizobium sp. B2-5-9]|uniref:Transcriptional repressor BetI n=1 Tax=Mesorhizobium australicum (strain HAMBI 3006 / LMG 24608 / WSM2073) TaxID=754035 RepID=L0KPH3_MESAW|nr:MULTISPECIES: transcriptional regulator BetI [Mesorhizobium]AGB47021.1 transcriptional repressor BetI [Mesorhizobium australicum WSM2073]MBZ9974819.1 transcriptional regulator BetI [Mesorhizobium sp. BR-1-1-10]TPK18400.1 transcriptional regulator BetI [Mesorhizobium sp. B2-5-9]TPK81915.1 transcriptional regulator BetI [Mesorhizobium sp. B2-4-13]TPL85802.1 transcriptional regulator BetI [Mesorhizobium sp. B2-3-14]
MSTWIREAWNNLVKLKRLGDIRRKELRQAAFAVLEREGIAGATLEKVAAHAGASKGIVLHYFRNKQELFEHAMREANAVLCNAVVARLRRARTSMERLDAVIEGNFEEHLFLPPLCHAWLSLCAEVPRDEKLARIQKVIHGRMRSNLLSGLRGLASPNEADDIALGVTALIDGLWLRLGLQPGSVSREQAIRQVKGYVAARLATQERSTASA